MARAEDGLRHDSLDLESREKREIGVHFVMYFLPNYPMPRNTRANLDAQPTVNGMGGYAPRGKDPVSMKNLKKEST